MKEHLVRFANVLAILGLTVVGAAVLAAVLLVTWYVAGVLPDACDRDPRRRGLRPVVRGAAGEPIRPRLAFPLKTLGFLSA